MQMEKLRFLTKKGNRCNINVYISFMFYQGKGYVMGEAHLNL